MNAVRLIVVTAAAAAASALSPTVAAAVTATAPAAFPDTKVGSEARATVVLVAEYPPAASDELVGAASLTGPAAADYRLEADGCSGARVRAACRLTVVFAPSAAGARVATLTVPGANGTAELSLSATGFVLGRALAVQPQSIDFGFGSQFPTPVTITNAGDLPVSVTGLAVRGAHAASFTLSGQSCLSEPLAPGQACSAALRFLTPSDGIRRFAQLVVACAPYCASAAVDLTGMGTAPVRPAPVTAAPIFGSNAEWTLALTSARFDGGDVIVRTYSSHRAGFSVRVHDRGRTLALLRGTTTVYDTLRLRPRGLRRGRVYKVEPVGRIRGRDPVVRNRSFRR